MVTRLSDQLSAVVVSAGLAGAYSPHAHGYGTLGLHRLLQELGFEEMTLQHPNANLVGCFLNGATSRRERLEETYRMRSMARDPVLGDAVTLAFEESKPVICWSPSVSTLERSSTMMIALLVHVADEDFHLELRSPLPTEDRETDTLDVRLRMTARAWVTMPRFPGAVLEARRRLSPTREYAAFQALADLTYFMGAMESAMPNDGVPRLLSTNILPSIS